MKVAFTVWENRIAPLFDVARVVLIVEVEAGRIINETQRGLPEGMMSQKALALVEAGVATLVCGAISCPTQAMITDYGIQVIPFVAGNLREIIQAWIDGRLNADIYAMPGCTGRGWRHWAAIHGQNMEGLTMNGNKQGGGQGGGKGGGRGQGGGMGGGQGSGRGRMGGGAAGSGIGGNCKCPKCGHIEAHEQGVPCMQKKCPKCGAILIRE